jgi:hypothetical protein
LLAVVAQAGMVVQEVLVVEEQEQTLVLAAPDLEIPVS